MTMRIGHGFDVHAFDDGSAGVEKIVIGGMVIPSDRGLVAHSDGDVLLHALCDALLGAAALGDIGQHFPDTDMAYKNADSRALLNMVYAKVRAGGFCLENADMTIVAQAPKMAPYIEGMCQRIASDLEVPPQAINVKATTTEKLGFTGRKEGVAAHAVVLLRSFLPAQPSPAQHSL